jgi:TPR repeat protein
MAAAEVVVGHRTALTVQVVATEEVVMATEMTAIQTKRRSALFTIVTLLAIPAGARAQLAPFSLFDNGEKRAYNLYRAAAAGSNAAFEELRQRGNNGDRWAAFQFGFLHHVGKAPGVGKDLVIAMKAYGIACRTAADKTAITGNTLAAYNMGLIYLYGNNGISPDPATAVKWFTASAGDDQHAFVPAAMNLANVYEHGYLNVQRDLDEAARWYRAAAAGQEPYALYKFGLCLLRGIGMQANQVEANLKLTAAADLWSREAMYTLAVIQSSDPNSLLDRNPVTAARWLLIASEGYPSYARAAQAAMNGLNPNQQDTARQSARLWLQSHARVPERVDYRAPMNTEPKYGLGTVPS